MAPGNIELDRTARSCHLAGQPQSLTTALVRLQAVYPVASILAEPVGQHGPGHIDQQIANHLIINAHNRQTIERQIVQKLDIGFLHDFKVEAIGFHMVRFDIGHHRHHGLQMQEGGVALIGLGHQIATAAQLGIGACTIHPDRPPQRWGRGRPPPRSQ